MDLSYIYTYTYIYIYALFNHTDGTGYQCLSVFTSSKEAKLMGETAEHTVKQHTP